MAQSQRPKSKSITSTGRSWSKASDQFSMATKSWVVQNQPDKNQCCSSVKLINDKMVHKLAGSLI